MNPVDAGSGRYPAGSLLAEMRDALRSAPPVARGGPFPDAWWQHLARRGMLGVGFDAGGRAARADWPGIAALAGVISHESAHLGLALAWLMNEMLGRFVLGPFLANEDECALLRLMAEGRKIVALAISEPNVGAHPKLLQCSARRHDGQWLLDGEKSYASNGPAADAFVVIATTGEHMGRKQFDAFLVDADARGLNRTHAGAAAVLPPLGHCGLSLVACPVADVRRLGAFGNAFDMIAKPMRALEDSLLAGATVGTMRAQLEGLTRGKRGANPTPETVEGLGALRLELQAIETLATECARELGRHGPGERLADLNAGVRIVLQRWQDSCEAVATALGDPAPEFLDLASDVRAVLGIARRVSEARHMKAGIRMVSLKGTS
ncbi:acyl-CoA dehydrogenase family protein [Hydrogenophaga intermedia]|uniref:acyl-CoA dehydrogenase family protein n=1 Tax=Hydrogenophaga intermedia TaxID=65786 RepID=UPI00204474BD|nr:acyl-CoA dehydrogenase family protein [Hydrogenophaga intermedia]